MLFAICHWEFLLHHGLLNLIWSPSGVMKYFFIILFCVLSKRQGNLPRVLVCLKRNIHTMYLKINIAQGNHKTYSRINSLSHHCCKHAFGKRITIDASGSVEITWNTASEKQGAALVWVCCCLLQGTTEKIKYKLGSLFCLFIMHIDSFFSNVLGMSRNFIRSVLEFEGCREDLTAIVVNTSRLRHTHSFFACLISHVTTRAIWEMGQFFCNITSFFSPLTLFPCV